MAEKIVNGGFTTDLANWSNVGLYPFLAYSQAAAAESGTADSSPHQHKLRQYFAVSHQCNLAIANVWIAWDLYQAAGGSGAAGFIVRLTKPSSDVVNLASHSEDAIGGDNNGSLQLLDNEDITAHIDEVGEYMIELECTVTSAWYVPIDDPVYIQSFGFYDSISMAVNERLTKMVIEAIGGGEASGAKAGAAALEVAGVHEMYSMIGGATAPIKFEKMGFQESVIWDVAAEKVDGAGLGEVLTRTYGYRQHDVTEDPEPAGLGEALVARWQEGNFTQTRDILAGPPGWTQIPPAETYWEGV